MQRAMPGAKGVGEALCYSPRVGISHWCPGLAQGGQRTQAVLATYAVQNCGLFGLLFFCCLFLSLLNSS